MKRLFLLLVLMLFPLAAHAQVTTPSEPPRSVPTLPGGACSNRDFIQTVDTNKAYLCQSTAWVLVATGNTLADPGGNGFLARTALNATAARTLTGTANQVLITNTTGGGDPVFSLPQSIDTGANPQFNSIGVGQTASGTAGTFRLTENVSGLGGVVLTNSNTGGQGIFQITNDTPASLNVVMNGSATSNSTLTNLPNSGLINGGGAGGAVIVASNAAGVIRFGTGGGLLTAERWRIDNAGNWMVVSGGTAKIADSTTAPTISSGFGTSPSVVAPNGTVAFTINVGTGGTATNGVIGLPTATTGWVCWGDDLTTQSSTVFILKQIATSTTTATIANFNTAGAQAAWVASDILHISCRAR